MPVWRKNGAQRAAVDLPVIGNDGLGERIVTPHDDVAAVLALDLKPAF